MNALVGYTGFVGSNLYAKGTFDRVYNSKNIEEAYGLSPDLLIYAGMRAEKYLANHAPQKDLELVEQAEENIRRIAPRKLVLISTIDVFKKPVGVDENSPILCEGLHPYGRNRYLLECWVREHYPDALIVRLPGLFGIHMKKNFIYDYLHVIPFMLKKEKFQELSGREPVLQEFYELQENGFYRCRSLTKEENSLLREKFQGLGFTALNFTDSRSVYQFYPLERLWDDLQIALEHNLRLLHPATEPVSAAELYEYLTGQTFENPLGGTPAYYDYRTIHDRLYQGKQGYLCSKETVKERIRQFIRSERDREE